VGLFRENRFRNTDGVRQPAQGIRTPSRGNSVLAENHYQPSDRHAASCRVPKLAPSDLAAFERLGITPELLSKARVQRVTDAEAREVYGITGSVTKDMSGVVFPYFSPVSGQRVQRGGYRARLHNFSYEVRPLMRFGLASPLDCWRRSRRVARRLCGYRSSRDRKSARPHLRARRANLRSCRFARAIQSTRPLRSTIDSFPFVLSKL
jgi:hypothetical protein